MEDTRQRRGLEAVLPNKRRAPLLVTAVLILTLGSRLLSADTGTCGGQSITLPFGDVPASNTFFCSIAEAYFDALTNGTSPTTYSPSDPVPREQMAAFITRTQDSALRRGNRRAVMQQWWTPGDTAVLRPVSLGPTPEDIMFDGQDLWVPNQQGSTVSRVRASDGRLMQTWTAAQGAIAVIAAAGKVFVAAYLGNNVPGKIYSINPEAPSGGAVTEFESDIGFGPVEITFDGVNLWTANLSGSSITRVTVGNAVDSTFTGFNSPRDILWDGANLWVANSDNLKRVDPSNGTVLESITVGAAPGRLMFDGTNLWVSNFSSNPASISVVRAVGGLRGAVLATLTGNGLAGPSGMAFDGERMLVCNFNNNSVSLFKAADLTPLGNLSTGASSGPESAQSDGVNFWIVRKSLNDMVRF